MKRAFLPFALILVGSIGLTHTFTKLNAQDTTAPAAHSTLRLRTPNGWVELSAPTGAGFVVDGGSVQVEGMSNEPMSLERTADGFSLVCNGWTYTTAGAFTMSKDGTALVVGEGSASAGTTAATDDTTEGELPDNPIKVAGETPAVDPVPPAKEPAAKKPR